MEMKPRSRPPRYKIWMQPRVHAVRGRLPGNMRQRIRYAIDELAREPRPSTSQTLSLPDSEDARIKAEWEARRIKLDDWLIVYAISETWQEITVLSLRQRPPYDYEDLEALLAEL